MLQVFNQVLAGLLIMHLMMIGLMGIKKFACTPLLIPLPLITIAFKVSMDSQYKRPLSVSSLRAAHDLDMHDNRIRELNQGHMDLVESKANAHHRYSNPAMRIKWEDLEKVLAEAKRVSSLLADGSQSKLNDDPSEDTDKKVIQ